jgi:membrane-associated phospholipid phosphatase
MNFIDQSILNLFVNHRVEWFTFVMFVITYCGSYLIIFGLTLLSAASFYIHKHTARILPLFMAVAGSAATTYLLKHIFFRARPIVEALYLETGSSFPSGHATATMALYGFLLYTIWKHDKHYLKKPLAVFLFILIILVGVSRLYLGVHYLSDVLVGYAIGFIWLLLSIKLHKLLLRWEWFKLHIF